MTKPSERPVAGKSVHEFIAEVDTGGRNPVGSIPKNILFFVPLAWTFFQLWNASPLPYLFNIFILNSTEARAIHLAFAMFLAYTAFPTFKSSPRNYIPFQDWGLALIASASSAYIFLFYTELSSRPGAPLLIDLIVAVVGLILLLEATRRALGPPLMVVAAVFMLYAFAGAYMPDVIAHKGASLTKGMTHYWLTTEGVFGVALGVSTDMVFMFVLFGSLLEAAGAGNYFIRTAFAGLGHMRGGPAKAAVVSSAMTGLVSGSSIANVVTTGTFTIPLMKKVGFTPEKAGAVEVASSTNGQLTPPVMGAAAFLMVEYVGISYIEVIKHAFLPAIVSYIALVYIVHLEACKMGLKGMVRKRSRTLLQSLFTFVATILTLIIIGGVTYYGLGWIKTVAGEATIWVSTGLLLVAYIALLKLACKVPELEVTTEITELPPLRETAQAGFYFLLPIVVLMWCLTVERLSPSLSAFWATVLLMFIVITQRPLKRWLRKSDSEEFSFGRGWQELISGMVSGARNMIGIGVATSAAGIIVGTVTLTGIGLVMTAFVEFISGGNLVLILLFTAVISLLLGMGLPTTANYIVVSTLMAPVIVSLGAQNGLIVPLIAVHLFVFYFGILADDTPPVGLAAFAAAGISGGDPIRTGIQGFTYDIRTAILPFIFIFNNEILMIGVGTPLHFVVVVFGAVVAMLMFAAATQGYFLTRNKIWETICLLLVTFTLLRPGFFWDQWYPELTERPATELVSILDEMAPNSHVRLQVKGEKFDGNEVTKTVMLSIGDGSTGEDRLRSLGLTTTEDGENLRVGMVMFGSPADRALIRFGYEITSVHVENERPPKQLMFIPALLLLALIWFFQRRRVQRQQA
ncbi:TRAP transporter permease [Desulfofustis glycolicus]|uniref:TRAP transporter, 4TM/12TM fusion protein n=1 Tax=Desulfofustis glycolicus DSM 9705 TaxID=1121409 RepID=A0A1M5W293_9BACT|nr:TRAP transporter permease [Desulfofustis glycolicus]MCB2215096.1 TRAP transporter permease [Desulfobulbaceae bacterium]SHH81548.1 TRAP transporter, 4TM/12TM fusion protein [Desulfofustis glycolicus DSM 9705]